MKILYLNPSAQLGGAEAALRTLLAAIREQRADWNLELIVTEDGPLIEHLRHVGVAVQILPIPLAVSSIGDSAAGGPAGRQQVRLISVIGRLALAGPSLVLYLLRLRKAIRRAAPDVVQSNGFKMHVLGALATPSGIPLVWHIHDYVASRPLMSRLLRMASRSCRIAVTNSNSVAADLMKLCPGLEVVTVHNAVDVQRFSPDGAAADLDALAGMDPAPAGTVRAGLVATMAKWKGHETFLRALAALPSDLQFRGYVIGGEVYQTRGSQASVADLKKTATELGLNGRVGFTGFIDDAAPVMRALDIVVHASTLPEPFGLVIVEGMASGRPVVVSAAGGAEEIVDACGSELSYAPGDSTALAAILARLISDAPLRERQGTDGRRCAETHFTTERLGREFDTIYGRLTAPAPGRHD